MYKIVLWNHNDEKPIDIKIGGYATEKDAWEDSPDMVEWFEQILTDFDYADGSVYKEDER